jgi:glycosyltransferase involved in cell wall biosynthesis
MNVSNKKGILMIMTNANGWRNPGVYGGGEIQTVRLIDFLGEFRWFICSPIQLKNLFVNLKTNVTTKLFKNIFSETNVVTDILQGVYFTVAIVFYGVRIRNEYDVIYSATTNFSDILPSKIIALLTGKKLVVKYHISLYTSDSVLGLFRSYRKEQNTVIDSAVRALIARISLFFLKSCEVIVVSDYLRKQLLGCGLEESRIHLNYNGTDFTKLEDMRIKEVKKKYDVCFMGRIEKSKGVVDFVTLVSKLKSKKGNISAVMIGDGSAMDEVTSLIKTLNLEREVQVLGFLGNERYQYLQESSVFVFPSIANEGFGLSILEALYFGVPVVMYEHPVLREVFSTISNTYFTDPYVDSLSDKIYSLLTSSIKVNSSDVMIYSMESCAFREKGILLSVLEKQL